MHYSHQLQVLNTSEDSITSSFAYEETKAWRSEVDFLNTVAEPRSELVSPSQGYKKKTLLPTNSRTRSPLVRKRWPLGRNILNAVGLGMGCLKYTHMFSAILHPQEMPALVRS